MEKFMEALTRKICEAMCEAKGVDKNIVSKNWDVIWAVAKHGNEEDLKNILENFINKG